MIPKIALSSVFACALIVSPPAFAEGEQEISAGSQNQCGELVKECFSSSGLSRSNCFYTAAKHPFCEGTEIGRLAYRRWTIAAGSSINGMTPPGLLGPNIYDEQCVSNCDTKWLSELVPGEVSAKSIENVSSCFEQCKQESNLEILRP